MRKAWEIHYANAVVCMLPIRQDNFIFVLIQGKEAAVVDPGEAAPALAFLRSRALRLTDILVTHGHHDHVDGVQELRQATRARLIAPVGLPHLQPDISVEEGDLLTIGQFGFQVWSTPGHQPIHVAYIAFSPEPGLAFIGDTLFGAGCGRLFGSQPALLFQTLRRLSGLPRHMHLYCGHEFTETNLAFALQEEPGHPDLLTRVQATRERRARGEPTLPLTLEQELPTNPFLRAHEAAWRTRLNLPNATDVEIFAELRRRKDAF